MKQIILNYKLQVLAVGVLALAQVSSFNAHNTTINRYVAQASELGSTTNGGVVIGTESIEVNSNDRGREDKIFDAYKKFQEKSKECLIAVKHDDAIKSAFRDYRLDSSDENLESLSSKLSDSGLLSLSSSSSSDSNSFRDRLLSLDNNDSDTSSSSGVLDPDKKSDLKEISRCHERRIQDLDSAEEKRAYFKKIEHKFADMLAESDSKEVSELAKEFLKTAKSADPNNAQGLQTIAQLHSEYAIAMANGLAQIKLLEQQLAANPSDQLIHSRLQLAKTTLDNQFSSIQTRYMSTINPQSSNAMEQMTAIQTITNNWNQQKTNAIGGQTNLPSFGNMVNANGITGDPVIGNGLGFNINGGASGTSTLPSIGSGNLLTIPQIANVPNSNLMAVRGDSRMNMNMNNYNPNLFNNPANRVQNTGSQVPTLGMAK